MSRPEDFNPNYIAYETIATEVILSSLSDFAPSIEWRDRFEELDDSTRRKLRDIDQQILEFTGLDFPPAEARLQRLVMVFFDCYLGFKQGQDTAQQDPYESLVREPWQRRFRKYRTYQPTGKKILCTYSGGIDYSMRLNTYWLTRVIKKVAAAEGKSNEHLIRELGDFLSALDDTRHIQFPTSVLREALDFINGVGVDKSNAEELAGRISELLQTGNMLEDIHTPTDLLKAIMGYVQLTRAGLEWTSKVDLRNQVLEDLWDLVDLMLEVVQDASGRKTLGGAAATGADALVTLELVKGHNEEPEDQRGDERNLHLLIPFAPASLLDLLDPSLKILWYTADPPRLQVCTPQDLKLTEQPEIRNLIIEFSPGAPIVYCYTCGGSVTPKKTDRLILRNSFAYYVPDGCVDRAATQQYATRLKVKGLFGFDSSITDSLSSTDRTALAEQAAANSYDILLASGLQSLDKTAHDETEKQLALFCNQETKIHIEISGEKNLDWLIELIPKCIHSVGVGEELSALFQAVKNRRADLLGDDLDIQLEALRFEKLEDDLRKKPRGYQKVILALEVAQALNLPRLYVHDVGIDIIICADRLSEEQRFQEIRADLVAKWVVLRKLMTRGQITQSPVRDTMTQVKEEGFATMIDTARALYEKLRDLPDVSLELYGTYVPEYNRTVLLVPVRWVYGAMQDQLRVTGAGDTTSIVSAVQAIKKA